MASGRPQPDQPPGRSLNVVLFSGGRGSGALARQLVSNPSVHLTLAINGYDDGASTGEVRRFLGDSLGPSDFRKNASTVARALRTCPEPLIELLDARMPPDYTASHARASIAALREATPAPRDGFSAEITRLMTALDAPTRAAVAERLNRFDRELGSSGKAFDFRDCSVGNLVFAGSFLLCDRRFNAAVDDYCRLMRLPDGLIENVTAGANALLVAIDADGRLLASEEAIVDAARPNRIRDIYIVDRPLVDSERLTVERGGAAAEGVLNARAAPLSVNPRLAPKIASADLIVYAPGTQHSSLFPSYLTPGLGELIAANFNAMKLLVTNIQSDAEITGSSAIDLVDRAVYYLQQKGRHRTPTPFLITHCLLNDPTHAEVDEAYVPLGSTDAIEDPRLVRIGNYEEGVTGRHDATRVLEPFIASIVSRDIRPRVAVLLHGSSSLNKATQTMLEMVRGGIADVAAELTVFYAAADALDASLAARLPFAVWHLRDGERGFADAAKSGRFDYVLLFESSGMYRGEETVPLLSQLATRRLDAVWGSRRLSLRDIEESYRFRYRRNVALGAISYIGSHMLSIACLVLYGRYITDTLSGVRAVRAADALEPAIDPSSPNANHNLLARLLRRKAEILEMPVRFFPLSPERVRRTSPLDGVRALATLLRHRFSTVRSSRQSTPQPQPIPRREGTAHRLE